MKKSIRCFAVVSTLLLTPSLAAVPVCAAPAAKALNHDMDAPLNAAVAAKKADQVRDLLQKGADPNAKTVDGQGTPLLCLSAINGEPLEITRLLVQSGADLEAMTRNGDSALTAAALAGNLNTVNYLLKAGAKLEANGDGGMTALICAAAAGKTDVVQALLKAGANVNAVTVEGGTALIYGSAKTDGGTGNLATVKLLVDAGADVSATTTDAQSAIDLARAGRLNDIGEYLEGIKARDERLLKAVVLGDWAKIKEAVAAGANPRYHVLLAQVEGDTQGVYTTAAMRLKSDTAGFDAAVAAKILAKSDLEACGDDGDTALALAVLRRDLVLTRLLLKAGANPNVVSTETGETPLMIAASFGVMPMVQALVGAGAKTDAKATDGRTVANFSRRNPNKDVQDYFANLK